MSAMALLALHTAHLWGAQVESMFVNTQAVLHSTTPAAQILHLLKVMPLFSPVEGDSERRLLLFHMSKMSSMPLEAPLAPSEGRPLLSMTHAQGRCSSFPSFDQLHGARCAKPRRPLVALCLMQAHEHVVRLLLISRSHTQSVVLSGLCSNSCCLDALRVRPARALMCMPRKGSSMVQTTQRLLVALYQQ